MDALQQDSVSELLRRLTRNPLGSARRGSLPLAVVLVLMDLALQKAEDVIDILLYICTFLGDWVILASDHDWTLCVEFKLSVLGVCVDSKACSSTAVHRQTIAHFEAGCKVLCNRRIPLKARIARFYVTCGRTLLYGCGTWTITDALAHEIAVCELRFLYCTRHHHQHIP